MKWPLLLLIIPVIMCYSCASRNREEALNKREMALNQKEQELILKEKTLQLKEEELLKKEQQMDSLVMDSTQQLNPALLGDWAVTMTCTETTCTGSAVGDTRTEEWTLSLQNNQIVARAMSGDNLVRVYTGKYTGNTLELVETRDQSMSVPTTTMVVRLRVVDEKKMEGQREIVRDNQCKVVYAIEMQKKQ